MLLVRRRSFSSETRDSKATEGRKEGKTGEGRLRRCTMICISFFLLGSGFFHVLLVSYEEGGRRRRRLPTIVMLSRYQPTPEGIHRIRCPANQRRKPDWYLAYV